MIEIKPCGCAKGPCTHPDMVMASPEMFRPEPDVEEIRQYEEMPLNALPMRLEGVANVQSLPAKRGEGFTKVTAVNSAESLIEADPRIKRVIIENWGANPCVIGSEKQVKNSQGYTIPATSQPRTWEGANPFWIISTLGTTVSYRIEYWAD